METVNLLELKKVDSSKVAYTLFDEFRGLVDENHIYLKSIVCAFVINKMQTTMQYSNLEEFIEKAREEVENNLLENKIIEIIDCYDIEDCKYGIKDILDKHDKILNTSGEKNKEEYITTIKVAN